MSLQEIQETVNSALQKASNHMEDSLIVAYISLLLGCIIKDDQVRFTNHFCFRALVN